MNTPEPFVKFDIVEYLIAVRRRERRDALRERVEASQFAAFVFLVGITLGMFTPQIVAWVAS